MLRCSAERGCQTTTHARSVNRNCLFRSSSATRLGRQSNEVRRTTTRTWIILHFENASKKPMLRAQQLRIKIPFTTPTKWLFAGRRIGLKRKGVIAFVTNGSWIDGNVDSGVRACLAEEFSSIYVLHLRGNQRTQGERSKREGGKVFGQGSRAPVAITILVKNPNCGEQWLPNPLPGHWRLSQP